jgi:tetratricopeptide (TPR) repeat protein
LLASTLIAISGGSAWMVVRAHLGPQADAAASDAKARVSDKPLARFQARLLDMAFKAASAMPVDPHLKNRSRAQQAVGAACFELDQPRRALGYVEQIGDWRRGEGLADFAFYCARHGDESEVDRYLELAHQVAESSAKGENSQDWQIDRINVTIAKTHAWLGHASEAARLASGTADSEAGKVEAVQAMLIDASSFEQRVKELDAIVANGNFDQTRGALETYAQLFNRFYGDREKRDRVEQSVKDSWSKLPTMARIEVMLELAGFAADHHDQVRALALVDETQKMFDGAVWTAEFQVPLMARIARLCHRAGDRERARNQIDAALAMFAAKREEIVDIYRAGALRTIAETYQAMGETAAASKTYKQAIEAGIENPNSRPRAEDLSATLCSMAVHGVEPDAGLWTRITDIEAGLGDPW